MNRTSLSTLYLTYYCAITVEDREAAHPRPHVKRAEKMIAEMFSTTLIAQTPSTPLVRLIVPESVASDLELPTTDIV